MPSRAGFVQFESSGLHGEAQPTVGSSMIPFAASARNKQQISRGPVVPSGLDFSNSMILLDEYEPVGLPRARRSKFCSEPATRFALMIAADSWCSAPDYAICDCVSNIPRLRSKAVLRLGLSRIIIHNCGNFSVALMAITSPLLLATLTHGPGLRPRATPQGEASAQLPATRLANRVTLQPKWIGL